jgi:TPR repeat protein
MTLKRASACCVICSSVIQPPTSSSSRSSTTTTTTTTCTSCRENRPWEVAERHFLDGQMILRNLTARVNSGATAWNSLTGRERLSLQQAVAWLKTAGASGHAGAAFALGQLFYSGNGVVQSDSAAVYWWKLAAGETAPPLRRRRHESAIFIPAFGNNHSGMGHAGAMTMLAHFYLQGRGGLRDEGGGGGGGGGGGEQPALRLFRNAAARGDACAMLALARMHKRGGRGKGRSHGAASAIEDDESARRLYLRALEASRKTSSIATGVLSAARGSVDWRCPAEPESATGSDIPSFQQLPSAASGRTALSFAERQAKREREILRYFP